MADVTASVADLATLAAGSGSDTLTIDFGTLLQNSLARISGYSTITVNTNAPHVISIPNTILSAAGVLTLDVNSTVSARVTAATLTATHIGIDISTQGGDDTIIGGPAGDTLNGAAGRDSLSGGQGADRLDGGAGGDLLNGNLGNDTLTGGDGADIFQFTGAHGVDLVTDFDAAEGDRILLAGGTGFTTGIATDGSVYLLTSAGSTVTLSGIAPADFSASWVLTV